jgi:hypothetical protein
VSRRRGLLLVILIYVTLDLSLPAMPGAFVFDPAGSVESIDVARGRLTTKIVALPTPGQGSLVLSPQARGDLRRRLRPSIELALHQHPLPNCLPRASCTPPGLSEDPH